MADVFLSYSSEDRNVAGRLYERLRADGFSVFFDQKSLVAGMDFSEAIERELAESPIVVVMLSRKSNRITWVEPELRQALKEGERAIIPVLLDEGAKDNWIWPLISNRQAVSVESPEDLDKVVQLIEDSVQQRSTRNHLEQTVERDLEGDAGRRLQKRSASPPWLIIVVALLSAIIGGIIVWLLR